MGKLSKESSFDDITAVIPTLNERENIGILIRYIEEHYKSMRIMVVDDGSSDGTKDVVAKAAKKYRNVIFIDRKAMHMQKGLTASIVHGITSAKTRFVIVMDADMQHPPEIIGKIAQKLRDCNIVVATRASVKNWALYRKIISKSMIYLGYAILVLRNAERCSDIFSGYFGVDRKLFAEVYARNKERFVPYGYKALYDFLKCIKRGQTGICEVPYDFRIREKGSSKAGIKQGIALFKSFFS
ncbi:MAG: glycosyltransferase [Candidatus Micrarchaeia archaeon]